MKKNLYLSIGLLLTLPISVVGSERASDSQLEGPFKKNEEPSLKTPAVNQQEFYSLLKKLVESYFENESESKKDALSKNILAIYNFFGITKDYKEYTIIGLGLKLYSFAKDNPAAQKNIIQTIGASNITQDDFTKIFAGNPKGIPLKTLQKLFESQISSYDFLHAVNNLYLIANQKLAAIGNRKNLGSTTPTEKNNPEVEKIDETIANIETQIKAFQAQITSLKTNSSFPDAKSKEEIASAKSQQNKAIKALTEKINRYTEAKNELLDERNKVGSSKPHSSSFQDDLYTPKDYSAKNQDFSQQSKDFWLSILNSIAETLKILEIQNGLSENDQALLAKFPSPYKQPAAPKKNTPAQVNKTTAPASKSPSRSKSSRQGATSRSQSQSGNVVYVSQGQLYKKNDDGTYTPISSKEAVGAQRLGLQKPFTIK